MQAFQEWLRENRVTEVECLVADINGIARGKILPARSSSRSIQEDVLRLPESIFIQTVTGDYPEDERHRPDRIATFTCSPTPTRSASCPGTRSRPPRSSPTASISDGLPVEISVRHVLRRVLAALRANAAGGRWWRPSSNSSWSKVNTDPDLPLQPPVGRSRPRRRPARQSYGIDAVNEFDPIFEDVYDCCEKQELDIDTLIHEAGAGQMEINFNHGDPLDARRPGLPVQAHAPPGRPAPRDLRHLHGQADGQSEPGSSMHIHQSISTTQTGRNLFADSGRPRHARSSALIGGLQKLPAGGDAAARAQCELLPPAAGPIRRRPINVHWGSTTAPSASACRCPSRPARRIENRIAGADANPYLAIAASLACGYLGMVDRLKPTDQIEGSAYRMRPDPAPHAPRGAQQAAAQRKLDGRCWARRFIACCWPVKHTEHDAYQRVISSWEREHLLLNV